MICDACVRKPNNGILRQYAGARGWMVLAPSQDVVDVKQHDDIARSSSYGGELRDSGGPYKDGRSWQIFGLTIEAEPALKRHQSCGD